MILLLAASYQEAEDYCGRYGIDKWLYIYSAVSLRGMGKPVVCRAGMYWQRSDITSIEHELKARQAIYISPVDIVKKTQ